MENLPFSSAAERNREPILTRLKQLLPVSGQLLEVGSGSGQHAVYFAAHFPGIEWQATEVAEHLPGLRARIRAEGGQNLPAPLQLDVLADPWPDETYAAAFSANTAHYIPWQAVTAMFRGIGQRLVPAAVFCLYGPFNIDNAYTSASNEAFDRWLRATDPRRGIRDLGAIETLAGECGMRLGQRFAMPANNLLLEFRRQ